MAAKRYLIPFPPQEPTHSEIEKEDTVFAVPKPEKLFQPVRRRLSLPRVIDAHVCVAGMVIAFVLGAASATLTLGPQGGALGAAPSLIGAAPTPAVATSAQPPVPAAGGIAAAQKPQVRAQRIRFRLGESKEFRQVGAFRLRLNKADAKRQVYTLTLQLRDKRVELQNRALAEPVRLYPAGAGPSEILIQRIEANHVEGYLRVPGSTR